MRYRDDKFYWTYQRGVRWPNDYIGPDSMTQWILEKSDGFTDLGLYKISESIRAYAYLILSSQASARSGIVGNTASALTAQSAFLNNFENVVNCRVDIREDIKRYQDTHSYTSSKVNYSMGQNIYMLPSDMRQVLSGTTTKFSFPMKNLVWGKNDEVNAPAMKSTQTATNSNDVLSHAPAISHKRQTTTHIGHNDEKIALLPALASGFAIWNMFR